VISAESWETWACLTPLKPALVSSKLSGKIKWKPRSSSMLTKRKLLLRTLIDQNLLLSSTTPASYSTVFLSSPDLLIKKLAWPRLTNKLWKTWLIYTSIPTTSNSSGCRSVSNSTGRPTSTSLSILTADGSGTCTESTPTPVNPALKFLYSRSMTVRKCFPT